MGKALFSEILSYGGFEKLCLHLLPEFYKLHKTCKIFAERQNYFKKNWIPYILV